jgi:hypothetical protein
MQVDKIAIFSIDAESVGLCGDHFAVGWSIRSLDKADNYKELEFGYEACPINEAEGFPEQREWVKKNIIPNLPTYTTVNTPKELYENV